MQKPANDFPLRAVSGAIIFVVTVVFGLLGGWWFTAFVLVIIAVATYELWQLLQLAGYRPSLIVASTTAVAAFVGIRFLSLSVLAPAVTLVLLASLAWQLRHTQVESISDWAISFAGGLYLGWTGGHLAAVRELPPDGRWWLALTLATLWLADSAAYVIGRRFGKHKLAPSISPGKTWEGYVAGIVVGTLSGAVVGVISPLGLLVCTVAGFLVSTLSVFGDLIESMIKRQAGVKDSGLLIPGHGGVLDRIDSLLWAGVIVVYVALVVGQMGN